MIDPPSPARPQGIGFFLDMMEIMEQKGNMDGATQQGEMVLREPACDVGCRVCYLACAIRPARLAWWEGEVERLLRERAPYEGPGWHQWRAHLQAAQDACATLKRQIEATRNMAARREALAAHLSASPSTRLH
jgi:hypothetical protein